MSRNQLGARLPPPPEGRQEVPRLLPDGSESQHHNGSFGAYMAHKEHKLGEQFHAAAAALPGQQRTRLFERVAIHVDGLTNPSHLVGAVWEGKWEARSPPRRAVRGQPRFGAARHSALEQGGAVGPESPTPAPASAAPGVCRS